MTAWTEEQDAELTRLVGENLSAAQIGARLGVSRNAVIGRLGRIGVALPHKRMAKPNVHQEKARQAPYRRAAGVATAPAAASAAQATPAPLLPPAPCPTTFAAAVDADRCLFFAGDPYGRDGADMPVCGGERTLLSRYCAYHARLQYQPRAA